MTRLQTLALIALVIFPSLIFGVADIAPTRNVQGFVSGNDLVQVLPPTNTAPVITLVGQSTVTLTEGDAYSSAGATCNDTEDGAITVPAPTYSPALNLNSAGSYVATYTCTDAVGLTDTVTRTVNVNSPVGAGVIAFTQATSVIDESPDIPQVFWAGMPDVNGDGCLDLYIGSHQDDVDSSMLLHDNVGGVCQGTFTYFADADNYSQAAPLTPRITSRYMFGNWYGHPAGFWSFAGNDVDGSGSARYVLDPTFTTVGGQPQYLAKDTGCYGSRPKCVPLDVDGDGVIEMAYKSYDAPYNTGFVVDAATGATKYPSNVENGTFVGALVVFDVNNDGYPEIVNASLRGYFEYDSVNSEMDWVASRFTGSVPVDSTTGNHMLPLDYDLDGDLDLFVGRGIYNVSGTFEPYLYQNDGAGNFTEVTGTALAGITLANTAFNTTYGNSQIGDINNDGYPDIIFGAETFNNIATFLVNNGDGTFTRSADLDLTPTNFGGDSRRPWMQLQDYDNDGLLDIVHNGPGTGAVIDGQLFRNSSNITNNWLRLRVRGFGDNTDGLHSRITVFQAGTSNIVTHYQVGAFSAGYQNLITHAGLGGNAVVDVRVEFPHGGPTCNFANVSANQDVIAYRSCDIESYTPGSAIPLTYTPPAAAVNTTVNLIADSAVTPTANELVTFGVPFARGTVTDINEIRVSVGGTEVAVAADESLAWHSDNSIRAVTIQMQNVDMTGGPVTVTITDEGATVARLTKQPVLNGWADLGGATKNNHLSPRILPQHDPQYLADSGIVPPFKPDPVTADAYELYRDDMFNDWAGTPFDYSTSTGANWLFDRASAHFKGYMASGDTVYLAEAARAKQFYFSHIRNDGTAPAPAGGDGCFTYGGIACSDGKYIYPQPAKLALALLGDDTQWDNSLIDEMSLQAQLGWNQYWFAFPYDAENDGYTERSHGILALAILNAYEITGSAATLADLQDAITYTRDMQQTVFAWDTANGWGNIGCFRHSWAVHEGGAGAYPGDGVADDRRCSPWMSENIADFAWQAYWSTGSDVSNHGDLPEIMRRLGEAIESYAYNTSTLEPSAPQVGIQEACGAGCTNMRFCTAGNTPIPFYSISDVASTSALRTTIESEGRTDPHVPEMVLIHAAARYFETDATINAAHDARIARVNPDFYTIACADWYPSQGAERLFAWQTRSNAQRTWDWVAEQ